MMNLDITLCKNKFDIHTKDHILSVREVNNRLEFELWDAKEQKCTRWFSLHEITLFVPHLWEDKHA